MASSTSSKVTLKLLIEIKREKVLFAEASKVVIDFLFSLLSLRLGIVTMLVDKDNMVGSIANLYQSVENLAETYLQPNKKKDILLKPKVSISSPEISGLLPAANTSVGSSRTKLFMCTNRCNYNVTSAYQTTCPKCSYSMSHEVNYVGNKGSGNSSVPMEGGYVKEIDLHDDR